MCSNCYNGCSDIISDKCIRYTGVDVPLLGIKNGDSLSYVEQALVTFLTSTLDGTGIIIDIPSADLCALVSSFIPSCGPLTASTLFDVLIKTICSLQTQVTANATSITSINSTLATLNANYDVSTCLSGVTTTSGTHAILQAVITRLCSLITTLPSIYVAIADINTYISTYLNGLTTTDRAHNKMVISTAYEYFGPTSGYPTVSDNLSSTTQGTGYWEKVYECNGLNGTPVKSSVGGVYIMYREI